MAVTTFKVTLEASGTARGVPQANGIDAADTTIDTVKADTADAKTKIATAKTDTAAAKTSIATANTAAIAMSVTATQAALDVLVADGAIPTQAHVNTAVTAWNTLAALIVTAKANVASAKTLVDTSDTSAGTAKTAVDLSDTDAALAVTASQASQGSFSGAVAVTIDLASIATISKLRAVFNEILRTAEASGQFTQ